MTFRVSTLGCEPDSMRASVLMDTPDLSDRRSRGQSRMARAALIWAGVIVAGFMPLGIDKQSPVVASFMPLAKASNNTQEVAMATNNVVPKTAVQISAPRFGRAAFDIVGTEVLVIHRFSSKIQKEMEDKAIAGKTASSRKVREPKNQQQTYDEARYISKEGWDGFHAGSIRNAMISACRLVSFKMTLAKMSIFVEADGHDKAEPQIPIIRIIGKPVMQKDMARVATGQPYVAIRPAYHNWKATIRIRWDEDQFTLADVTNLLSRVGMQVGVGEGRPDSPNSCGMGWGTFEIAKTEPARKAA